jgi:hypothetical protein
MSNPCIVDKNDNQVTLQEGLVFWIRFDAPHFIRVYHEDDPTNPLLWQENGETSEGKAFLRLKNYINFRNFIEIIAQISSFRIQLIEHSASIYAIRICR